MATSVFGKYLKSSVDIETDVFMFVRYDTPVYLEKDYVRAEVLIHRVLPSLLNMESLKSERQVILDALMRVDLITKEDSRMDYDYLSQHYRWDFPSIDLGEVKQFAMSDSEGITAFLDRDALNEMIRGMQHRGYQVFATKTLTDDEKRRAVIELDTHNRIISEADDRRNTGFNNGWG